jgi:hypothetical protein
MYSRKYRLLLICIYSLGLFSCKEEKHGPLPNSDKTPLQISEVQVKNLHGGAQITFALPKGSNAQYVEAVWKTSKGIVRRTKASSYSNSLLLDGFGDTLVHEIKLYSVNKAERRSNSIIVKVKPLIPAIDEVFNSLMIYQDFGGCSVDFKNKLEANVVIGVITPDSTDQLDEAYDYYTAKPDGRFYVRGYPPQKRKFGVFVRDEWGNHSDTLYKEILPLYEVELDRSKFKQIQLPGDVVYYANPLSNLWDNNINTWEHTSYSNLDIRMPGETFTFDLGVTVKLSRFKLWQRYTDYLPNAFAGANWKKFEIWGRKDIPVGNGDWSNWTKIMDYEVIKPSGLPPKQLSNDDIEAVKAGAEFLFPRDAPVVRYLRIKVDENFGGNLWIYAAELHLWGQTE